MFELESNQKDEEQSETLKETVIRLAVEEVIHNLNKEVCRIKFKKKDGTLRELVGTTNRELIATLVEPKEEDHTPKREYTPKLDDAGNPIPPTSIRIFDLGISEWRSFNRNSVVEANVLYNDLDQLLGLPKRVDHDE